MACNTRTSQICADPVVTAEPRCLDHYPRGHQKSNCRAKTSLRDEYLGSVAGDAFALLYQGLADPVLLEYKPSLTAAAMLASCRCAAGIVPFWPATLETLTGYREQHAADFGAAMAAVGNLMTIVYTSADLHPHHSY